jgi:hypothetical protein
VKSTQKNETTEKWNQGENILIFTTRRGAIFDWRFSAPARNLGSNE